jgi:tRNA-2-methylthio-N6-dimethylallyladenosine synthase
MKLFTKTFGCQMNFADSDEMGRHFRERGFTATDNVDEADAVVVNTCTVRDLAEHKAVSFIGRMREWKDAKPGGVLLVTGCAAERTKLELRQRFPYIDLVVGAKDIESFSTELDAVLQERFSEDDLVPLTAPVGAGNPAGESVTGESSPVSRFVTIMRGCNYNCTYCIVPSVRGRERYRPASDILADVTARAAEGAREIILLGQTVNSYRPSDPPAPGYDFASLLKDVAAVPGVERVRFMSPHPYYLTPRLIDVMATVPEVCDHLHLPAHSGSDAVLRRMKRNYTREGYLKGVRALRAAVPAISITTDLIVGFPGETEDDFQETLSLVDEAAFDAAYCFKYSPRPGTASAAWADDIPGDVKERRVNELLARTDARGAARAQGFVGTIQEVLLEDDKGDGVFRGKTRSAWRARVRHPGLRIGQSVRVRITGSHSRELHGDVIS